MTSIPYVLIRLGADMPRRRRYPYTTIALVLVALGLFVGSIAFALWRVLTFLLLIS